MAIGDESCLGVSSDEGAEELQWGAGGDDSSVDGVGGGLHWAPPASTAATAALQRRGDATPVLTVADNAEAQQTFLEQQTFLPAVFGNTRSSSTFTTASAATSLMCNNAFPGTPAAAARDAAEVSGVNCVSGVSCVSGLTDVLSATQFSEPSSHCNPPAGSGATGEEETAVDMEDRREREEERGSEVFPPVASVGSSAALESMDDGDYSDVRQEEEEESAMSTDSSPERMESGQDAGVEGVLECKEEQTESVEDKEEKPTNLLGDVTNSMEEDESLDEVSVNAFITTVVAAVPSCDMTTWSSSSSSCGHGSCGVTYCNLYNTTTSTSTSSSGSGFFDSNAASTSSSSSCSNSSSSSSGSSSCSNSSSSSSSCSNNSHSSDDTDDCSGSDDDSILEEAVTSPPGVDNSRLFPNVEEVETRTGISFGRSPPHNHGGFSPVSPSSFTAYNIFSSSSSAGAGGQGVEGDMMGAGPAHQKHRAMELMQHSLNNIGDPDRFLRRFVLIRHNLFRLRKEARDERPSSHHRRRHQTSSSPFVTPSTLLPPASSTPPTTCYSSATYNGDSEDLRSSSPYPCTPTASSPYNLPGNSGMGRQPSPYPGHHPQGNRENVMEDMDHLLEPSPKRQRYCGAAEENKENVTYQGRETYGSGGASTGNQYYQNSAGHQYSSCSGGGNNGGYYGTGGDQVMYGGNHYMNQNSTHYTTNNTNYFSHSQYGSNQYDSGSSNSSFMGNNSSGNSSNYSISGAPSMDVDSYNSVAFNGACPDRRPGFSNGASTGFSSSNGSANTGFSSNGAGSTSSSFSSLIGIRSNIDTIIEHIDEQILRGSYSSSACSQSSSSSSSPSTSSSSYSSPSSQQPTDCPVSQCSSSSSSSSSTSSNYNSSSSTNNSNSFSSYSSHYGGSSSYYCGGGGLYGQSYCGQQQYGPSPCAVTAQQQQPYPCGRSSSLFAGGDFRSVVYSSLLASLES